jgi:hypothetical protein
MSPKHHKPNRTPNTKISQDSQISPSCQPSASIPQSITPTIWLRYYKVGLPILISVIFFVIYLITTSRSLPTGDSGEFISAAWILGVAHAPGYPIFTLLSHLAGYLPFGNPAFRMNLLSAILDTLALGILSWGTLRFLRLESDKLHNRLYWLVPIAGTLAGAGLLGISNAFWLYSTVAEVFALNNLFASITLVLMLEWVRQPDRNKYLFLSGLLAGLAMTNQQTFILLMPGLLTLLCGGILRWRRQVRSGLIVRKIKKADPGWRLLDIGITLGLFILGFLPYIYLPIAARNNPLLNWGNPVEFNSFWQVLTRSDYGTFSFGSNSLPGNPLHQLLYIGRYFLDSFSVIGILLAVLGIVWIVRHRQLEGLGIGLGFLFSGPIFALTAHPQLDAPITQGVFERFYILPSIPVAVFIAAGVVFLVELALKWKEKFKIVFPQYMPILAGLAATLVMVVILAVIHYPAINLSNNRVAEDYGRDLLEHLDPQALLIYNYDFNGESIFYTQCVMGFRTDVIALNSEMLRAPWYVEQQRHLHPEITIPFTSYDGGIRTSLGDLIRSNIEHHPVYAAGNFQEKLSQYYDEVYWGLTRRFVEKGKGTDAYALMKAQNDLFVSLHYPQIAYPPKYWECAIAEQYGQTAFVIAFTMQKPEAQLNADLVEKMYRIAILNYPANPSSYKNLGILLWKNGGSSSEIIQLWEKYLLMAPNDPGNVELRSTISALKNQP